MKAILAPDFIRRQEVMLETTVKDRDKYSNGTLPETIQRLRKQMLQNP